MPQTRVLRPGVARWILHGPDVRPDAREWRKATPDQRAAYYPFLATQAKLAMDSQLLAGEGTDGARMRAARGISRQSYRDRGLKWQGPGMSPQGADSRFVATGTTEARRDRVVGTWPLEVARLAYWHAKGLAGKGRPYFEGGRLKGWRGLPGQTTKIVRDFVGLNDKWLAWAVRTAVEAWRAWMPKPAPKPPKPAVAPAKPAPLPKPPTPKVAIPNPPAPVPPPPMGRGRSRADELLERYPDILGKYRIADYDAPVVLTPRTAAPPRPPAAPAQGVATRAIGAIRRLFGRIFGR
jgi:hypothetical protein